jgi:hypothetical protein
VQQLARVLDRRPQHLGGFRVLVLEDVFEQEHRPFPGDSFSSRTRNARMSDSERCSMVAGLSTSEVRTGSGSQGPMYSSRVARADFSRSRHRRVTMVVAKAFGERMAERSAPE